jgi:PEP-CTERM motif-containing protein
MRVSVYIFCLSALFCTSVFANLNTIEVSYEGIDAGGKQGIILNGDRMTFGNGVLAMDTKNPAGELSELLGDRIWGYCYELEQYASSRYNTYKVAPLQEAIAAGKAALISQLWAQHYDHSWEQSTLIDAYNPASTLENKRALAFSFAVYEIIYDYDGNMNDLDLSGGHLKSRISRTNPPEAVGIAQSWLNGLINPGQYNGLLAQLVSLNNRCKQDFIVEVPEPATMTMLALGSLAFLRKRRV